MKTPALDRTPLVVGLLCWGLWVLVHLFIHIPRGWPFFGPSEWDVLLVSQAVASGDAPHALVGALHGHELGAYLVAGVAALPIALGLTPLLAAKVSALVLGGAPVAIAVGWAARLGLVSEGRRGACLAGAITGLLLIFSWPDWHAVSVNLDGSTRHSVLPQLAAMAVVWPLWRGPSHSRAALAGALGFIGCLISPLAAATFLGLVGVAWLAPAECSTKDRCLGAASVLAGGAATLLATALILPGGSEAVVFFLRSYISIWLGPLVSEAATNPVHGADPLGPLEVIRRVPGSLTGRGGSGGWWPGDLSLQALAIVLTVTALARSCLAVIRRTLTPVAGIAIATVLWLAPLSVIPSVYRFYAPAYRFWSVPLFLGAIVAGILLGRWLASASPGPLRWVATGAVLAVLLCPVPGLPRAVQLEVGTTEASIIHAATHRMNRRPVGPHAAYMSLRPHAPLEHQDLLDYAYGLALGDRASEQMNPEWEADDSWIWLLEHGPADQVRRVVAGFGCGLAMSAPGGPSVDAALYAFWGARQQALVTGLTQCGLALERRGEITSRADLLDGVVLEPASVRGLSSTLQQAKATPQEQARWLQSHTLSAKAPWSADSVNSTVPPLPVDTLLGGFPARGGNPSPPPSQARPRPPHRSLSAADRGLSCILDEAPRLGAPFKDHALPLEIPGFSVNLRDNGSPQQPQQAGIDSVSLRGMPLNWNLMTVESLLDSKRVEGAEKASSPTRSTRLHRLSPSEGLLVQDAGLPWDLQWGLQTALVEPGVLDLSFAIRLRSPTPTDSWFGVHLVQSFPEGPRPLLLVGSQDEEEPSWLRTQPSQHLLRNTWPAKDRAERAEFADNYPVTAYNSLADERWTLPLMVGIDGEDSLILMAEADQDVYFTNNPIGLWGIRLNIHRWEVGACYTLKLRAVLGEAEPQLDLDAALRAYSEWSGTEVSEGLPIRPAH